MIANLFQKGLVLFFILITNLMLGQDKYYQLTFEERDNSIEQLNRASDLINKGKVKESFLYLVNIIRTDSTFFNVYGTLFKASMIEQNYSDSILNCFYKAKRVFDIDDNICYYIAEIYRFRKQNQKAIAEYTNAIKFSKSDDKKSFNYPSYFSGRAYCLLQVRNYKLAINDYSFYLKINPNDATILVNRGICYWNIKEKEKALIDWKRASKLGYPTAKKYIDIYNKRKL